MSLFVILFIFFAVRDLLEAFHDKQQIADLETHYIDAVLWAWMALTIGFVATHDAVIFERSASLWPTAGIVVAAGLMRASLFSVALNKFRGKDWWHLGTRPVDRALGIFGEKFSLVIRGVLFVAAVALLWAI